MNEKSYKRRAWVKNAAIIFLAIMLILTFFSNTIMNYSLPEVAAQYSQSGSITSKIRTTANVIANSTYKITIEETRNILSVAVKDGDMVKKGDVLFYLEDAESEQLKTARDTLAQLEKEYQLKLLQSGSDYYADELAITQKRDELKKAQEKLNNIGSNESLIETLEAEIKTLESQQKALTKQITAYQNQISKLQGEAADVSLDGTPTADRLAAAETKYNAAKSAYQAAEALKAQTEAALEAAEDAWEKANSNYESLGSDGSETTDSLTDKINELNKTIRRYKEDYKIKVDNLQTTVDNAYDAWVEADYAYQNALYLYNQGQGSKEAVDEWYQKSETARQNYESVVSEIGPQKDAAKLEYDRQMEDYSEELAKLQEQLDGIAGTESAKKALDTATKNKETATKNAEDASKDFDESKTELTEAETEYKALQKLQLLEECESILDGLNTKNDSITDQLEEKNEEKTEISEGAVSVEDQQDVVKTLTQELETLQHNLAVKKQEAGLQDQRDQIEIDEMLKKIDEQKELVKKYEANSVDAKITATVDGQVNSISAVAGSETTVGQTLCEIVATELGYSCEVPLTLEQSKRVRVGDSVTVSNSWWSDIQATIVSIKNDPKNPGNSKIASISLTGDVVVGQSLNLTIGEKGQNYDSVVPNSAIREDNNGKFVLVVESKSSPLGNRYIAKRVDVTVLESDDTNSAVSGLMGSEFVITTSTKPISAGDQVRMAETSK
ncbi:MAG TPA: HlyD family efflux transporter periplasmic adaptor subunit [Firmicutes bacterium]|nr:HlyD family efflux transporter periplasmic adaptor subunit [Bacillota bacterium]